MAYEKTLWEARDGSDLDRFEKAQETAKSVILRNAPNKITKPGTKFSIQNMNKIEQGIFDAHKMIASEETTREAAVGLLAKADELLDRMITAEGHSRLQADAALQTLIDLIMGLIPNQADVSNLLADKNFVNSTVSNLAAWFLTPDSLGTHQWPSLDALRTGPWYSGGTPKQPTQNDYAIFINQDEELGSVNSVWRALFSNELWSPQYKVNDTPFTAAQLSAINSNITQALVNKLSNPDTVPAQNSAELITSGGVFAWFGAAVSTLKTVAKNVVGALNELFETKIDKSEKGVANGVATLDGNGLVPASQLPEGGGILAVAHDDTLNGKGTSSDPLGINIKTVFLAMHPVNSIYMTVASDESTPAQMANKYGGAWAIWGAGRVPVSRNSSDTTFATVEGTGGNKDVTLTAAQSGIRAHGHTQNSHTHDTHAAHKGWAEGDCWARDESGNTNTASGILSWSSTTRRYAASGSSDTRNNRLTINATHGEHNTVTPSINDNTAADASQAHNNLQPYIVCYFYKRTA